MRRQGKVIRPDLVGRFSNPRALKIRGADQISEEEIFSALARSGRFLMASHPNEALGKFLRTLEQCLVDGYQASGFPEVTVKADWQDAEETIVVAITEGPRFNAGNVIIKGMRTVSQEALLEALLTKDEKERQPVDRGETFYQAMLEAKRLPPISLKDGFTEAFPYLFDENLEIIDTEEFDLSTFPTMEEDPPFFHFWEPGQWADYRSSTLEQAKFVTQNVYQWEKGLLLGDFETSWTRQADSGVVDLIINIREEGTNFKLGNLTLAGLQINSEDSLKDFLELQTGMEIKGDFGRKIRRKLYESGRFKGWEIFAVPAPAPNTMDVLIQVAEHWMAPPLGTPLSRSQAAMLRFARWFNHEAIEHTDLVLTVGKKADDDPPIFVMALGDDGLAAKIDVPGFEAHSFTKIGDRAELLIRAGGTSSFHAAFPLSELHTSGTLTVYESPAPGDPLKTTSLYTGGAASLQPGNPTAIGMDPASAVRLGSGPCKFVDGTATVHSFFGSIQFEEETGRLLSWTHGGGVLPKSAHMRAEQAVAEKMRTEIAHESQGVANWLNDKRSPSLLALAGAYAAELIQDDEFLKEGMTDSVITKMRKRMAPWYSVAAILGNAMGTLSDALIAFNQKANAPNYSIPSLPLPQDIESFSSPYLNMILAAGSYDMVSEYFEPGTWPDLVAREIVFVMGGKQVHLPSTVKTLLEDENMGPLGCLFCARLLQLTRNPDLILQATPQFITKARQELSREGIAKDWVLAFEDSATGRRGFGWEPFESLLQLTDDQISLLLPSASPESARQINALLEDLRGREQALAAADLRPLFDLLSRDFLNETVTRLIDAVEKGLNSNADPRVMASTVNGLGVPRATIKLHERIPPFHAIPPHQLGLSPLEACEATLLMALELWKSGQAAPPKLQIQQAEMIARGLGPDGWKQIEEMGFTKESLQQWGGHHHCRQYPILTLDGHQKNQRGRSQGALRTSPRILQTKAGVPGLLAPNPHRGIRRHSARRSTVDQEACQRRRQSRGKDRELRIGRRQARGFGVVHFR